MSLQSEVAKFIKGINNKQKAKTSTRAFHQGVVLSVDTVEGTAEVQVGDEEFGTVVTVYKQSGFLPAVGDPVMLQMNGAEPIVSSSRILVDGGMQSRSYVPGEEGWMIDAEGNAELNNAFMRGTIKTGFGDTYVLIQYDADINSHYIVFEEGEDVAPASIQRIDDATHRRLIFFGANSPSAPIMALKSMIAPPYTFFTDFWGDVVVNGLSMTKPPMAWYRRNTSQTIPDDTPTTLTGRTLINKNDPAGEVTGSRMVLGRVGTWDLVVNVTWALSASGAYRKLQLVNDTLSDVYDLEVRGSAGGLIHHSVTRPVQVTDAAHQWSLRVHHDAGGDLDVEYAAWFWKFVSD